MADIWATKTGNWSDTTVWNLGRLPTNGDVVAANGYAVTIDMDLTGTNAPAAILTSNIGGTASGTFVIASNRQIGDANNVVNIGGSGSTTAVITIQSGNYNVTFYANITGGSGGEAYGIRNNSTGTVTVTGNVTGGSGGSAYGIYNNSTGTVNVTGNVTGWSNSSAIGILNNSTGTVTVTGNVTGGSGGSAYGIRNNSTGTVSVTGNVVPASSTNANGVYNNSTGTITINGDVYGGRNQSSAYANNGIITINGDLRWDNANSNTAAISTSANGKIILNGNVMHLYATTGNYGTTLTAGRVLMRNGGNTYTAYAEDNGSGVATGNPVMHYGTSLHSGSMPNESNVRYGTAYGPGDSRTGTCYVPSPASVLYGVPVDNTVGTATIDAASIASAVWNALRSSYSTTGTFGAVSEWAGGGGGTADWTDDEKKQLRHRLGIDGDSLAPSSGVPSLLSAVGYTTTRAEKIDCLDATVSSRLATLAYTAPDNDGITAIKSQTDKLAFAGTGPYDVKATLDGEAVVVGDKTGFSLTAAYDRAKNALSYTEYTAPDNASIGAIKAKTDNLTFTGTDINATLDGETVVVGTNQDKTGYALTAAYDRAKNALAYTEYTAPDNSNITAIKAQTDKLTFDGSNNVYAVATVDVDEQAIADAVVAEITGSNLVNVVVQPLVANVLRPSGDGGTIEAWANAKLTAAWSFSNTDLWGHDLRLIVYNRFSPYSKVAEYLGSEVTITYTSPDTAVSITGADSKTPDAGNYRYVLRDMTTDTVLISGVVVVNPAPDAA